MKRPVRCDDFELVLLEAAYEQARKSLSEGGIPIGAALGTRDGAILAVGHNLREQLGDTTAHAETVCLRNAGRRRDWHELILASTLSPCIMCSGTAILHKIPRVVIGEHRTFMGAERLMAAEGVSLRVVDDPRCVKMMKDFIREQPEVWDEDIGIPPASGKRPGARAGKAR
ncbi:MAG: nucleoside deaminase [Phycisphaerales bacterium]|nr:nucleoside deaminase [Phycisphaerales bacterium]